MVIDFHTHTFPDSIAVSTLQKLSGVSHSAPFTDGTAAGLAGSMAAAGVDLSIVLPVATSPRQVARINESAARNNEHTAETGLFSFGCIHPDCENWREELDRIAALGLKGVKLHPDEQMIDLADKKMYPVYDLISDLGLPVVIHTGFDPFSPDHAHASPDQILKVRADFPKLRLILAHLGGYLDWDAAEELLAGKGMPMDTALETAGLPPEQAVRIIRKNGSENVFLGSDSPWATTAHALDYLLKLPLTDREKELIMGENAARLLGLKP